MLKPLIVVIALTCAGPAIACGNPLLWAMLFARVPDAKHVFDADLAAREAGTLHARVFQGADIGQSYHQWSVDWLGDAAEAMQDTVVRDMQEGEQVTILLADAVAALRFQPGAPPKVISAAGLDFSEGFDAITTVNALESGLYRGISTDQMIEQGVLLPTRDMRVQVIASLF